MIEELDGPAVDLVVQPSQRTIVGWMTKIFHLVPFRTSEGTLRRWYHYCTAWACVRTYHSSLIPEGVAEASQIFLQDAHVLPK
jgi:hypothetical protein